MALPTKLKLEIVTPERKLLSEIVDEVIIPGREGYLGVLPGHAPLLTSLKIGSVEYRKGNDRGFLALAWGFAEVLPDRVTILADIAERSEEIDVARAQARKEEVERSMRQPAPEFDFAKAQDSLQKAIIRIEVATSTGKPLPGETRRAAPKSGRMHAEGRGE